MTSRTLVALGVIAALGAGAPHVREPERIVANENRIAAGTLTYDVLRVPLEIREGRWYPQADDGKSEIVPAFGIVGQPLQVPGPLLRVRAGTEIRASIRNALDTVLVVHGLQPGMPGDSVLVPPRSTRDVRFTLRTPGTYFYWAAPPGMKLDENRGRTSQLSGALIVDPAGATPPEERVFVLGAWNEPKDTTGPKPWVDRDVMVINGKAWPHTERFTFNVGDTVRWRWVNPSVDAHPMHLHGFYYSVDSRGTWTTDTMYGAADRRRVVTEMMLPGGTMRMQWVAERAGNWLMHCHFAFHVSHFLSLDKIPDPVDPGGPDAVDHSRGGMAGLVLGLTVRDRGTRTIAKGPARAQARSLRLVNAPARDTSGGREAYAYTIEPPPRSAPEGTLLLQRGEPVRITIVNRLRAPTSVHWHGIEVEDSYADGVPGWSGAPGRLAPHIAPGDSFVAAFTPPRAGTFMYHAHSNEGHQISEGLYAPLIVLEPGATYDPSRDLTFIAGGNQDVPRVNRRREPAPVEMRVGVTYRLRLLNINPDRRMIFSLRSPKGVAQWRAIAKDGADLPRQQAIRQPATLLTGPGETADFEFTPGTPGSMRLDLTAHAPPTWRLSVPIRVVR